MNHKPKVLTWHIHGNYLYYLTQSEADFYVPYKTNGESGYIPLSNNFPWGKNVHPVPAEEIAGLDIDIVLFQSNFPSNQIFLEDYHELLSEEQKLLPVIYLEHEPPRGHPTDTKHIVNDPTALIVHVTHFNNLMWDNNVTPTKVIEHGVLIPENLIYIGDLERGVVVINNLDKRGRRLGLDIFEEVRKQIPLDLVGMGSERLDGLGARSHGELAKLLTHYRFVFNPIRYTSLGLSICEAMMIGMPIVGLSTTEMTTVIENGVNGYAETEVNKLILKMKLLLDDKKKAQTLSVNAKNYAQKRFNINKFKKEWEITFQECLIKSLHSSNATIKRITYSQPI